VLQFRAEHVRQPLAPVAFWTPARQLDFARWLATTFGHTALSIERRLDVLHSAFAEMTKVKLRTDAFGNEVECALMTHAPKFVYKRGRIARELKLAPPAPRHSQHTLAEVGAAIDALELPHLVRFAIIALNTWARPEAVIDFDPAVQVDRRTGLVDLNPPGRPQTTKHRARIPLTRGLAAWLDHWAAEDATAAAEALADGKQAPPAVLLVFQGARVASAKKALTRRAAAAGVERFSPGSFRHFMATSVRRLCRRVSREQRSRWLGHVVREGSRTTDWSEAYDPEYLADVALATDFVVS
jgi:integrase